MDEPFPFEPFTIDGRKITLAGDRAVWAGKHVDSWYIIFFNAGVETKLRISFEAADALIQLLTVEPEQVWRYILKMSGNKSEWAEVGEGDVSVAPADGNTK